MTWHFIESHSLTIWHAYMIGNEKLKWVSTCLLFFCGKFSVEEWLTLSGEVNWNAWKCGVLKNDIFATDTWAHTTSTPSTSTLSSLENVGCGDWRIQMLPTPRRQQLDIVVYITRMSKQITCERHMCIIGHVSGGRKDISACQVFVVFSSFGSFGCRIEWVKVLEWTFPKFML